MEKSFIERLTDEQIRTFIERIYPKQGMYSYEFSRHASFTYVLIHVHRDEKFGDYSFSFNLFEYNTWGFSYLSVWIKYLYEVFGEEYKQAYLDYCAKIFN